MPTTVVDQAFGDNFDPGVPPALPGAVTVITISILDANDDGLVTVAGGDQVNGSNVSAVYNGDTVTIDGLTITGATIYTEDGGRYFTPTDGTALEPGTVSDVGFVTDSTQLTLAELQPPCFVEGTRLTLANGEQKSVEDIAVGDMLATRDNGPKPVKWIGRRTVQGRGAFAPIVIETGALGNSRQLVVSPQHRMLLTGWRCEMYFGEPEMLCAAVHICNDTNVRRDERDAVTYYHIMLDQHEIIYAEDIPTESFFPGDYICKADRQTYLELMALMPELGEDFMDDYLLSRPAMRKREAQMMSAH